MYMYVPCREDRESDRERGSRESALFNKLSHSPQKRDRLLSALFVRAIRKLRLRLLRTSCLRHGVCFGSRISHVIDIAH